MSAPAIRSLASAATAARLAELDAADDVYQEMRQAVPDRVISTRGLRLARAVDVRIAGYASVWAPAYRTAGVIEAVRPWAFDRSLDFDPQVRLLVNHVGRVLASTTDGTLRVSADGYGLRVDALLDGADLTVQSVARWLRSGQVRTMSFGGVVTVEPGNGGATRSVTAVDLDGGDVSVIIPPHHPANPNTTVQLGDSPWPEVEREAR